MTVLIFSSFFFFNDTATTEIYTLSLHDALPISVLVSTGLVVLLLWASLVTALLLSGLHPFRDALDQRYDIEWLFLALALSANIPSVVITYCLDVLRLHFSPWKYSLLAALRSLPAVACGLFLIIALNQGLLGIFAGQVLAFTLAMPLGLWLIRKELRWQFDFGLAREIRSEEHTS